MYCPTTNAKACPVTRWILISPNDDFEQTRLQLIRNVNTLLTPADKEFMISFENAKPDWSLFDYPYFSKYPSVKWKLLNLTKLSKTNPAKLLQQVEILKSVIQS